MASSVLSLLSFSLLILSTGATTLFVPHKLSHSELLFAGKNPSNVLSSALTEVGLVSVTDIPNFAELREKVLVAATDCALHTKASGQKTLRFIFGDGTSRYTLGTKTLRGEQNEIEGADMSFPACHRFSELEGEFRRMIDDTTQAFVKAVDTLQGTATGLGRKLMFDKETEKHFESLKEIVDAGTQLEHFHTYEKFAQANNQEYTLDVHVDQGIFIALAPALILSGESKDHGFYIKLQSGEIVQPHFGDNNELVFMIGDGFTQWLNEKMTVPFRATPHAMAMPDIGSSAGALGVRSWYGRMILPSESAHLESQGKTFGELRREFADRNLQGAASLSACSAGLVIPPRQLALQCAEDEIVCWAQCRPIGETCGSNEVAKCVQDDGAGELAECDPTQHIGSCAPQCVPGSAQDNEDSQFTDLSNDFCNGFRVSMFMDGFQGVGDATQQCLVFLFPRFTLDDAMKYVLASMVTIVIGMTTEFVVWLRRRATNRMNPGLAKSSVRVALYATQVTFGYIAMLIAMTYSLVLFAMIIVGLTIGHRLFNFKVTPGEFSDPCCAQPVEEQRAQVVEKVEAGAPAEAVKDV